MFSTPAYINDNYQISGSNLHPELQTPNYPTGYIRPLHECPTCSLSSAGSSHLFFLTYFQCRLMVPLSTQVKQSLTPPASSQPVTEFLVLHLKYPSSPSLQYGHRRLHSEPHYLPSRWMSFPGLH